MEPQRSKFPTTSQFEKMGMLGILGSGNNSRPALYKSAIKEFSDNLDACGIQTIEPFSDQIISDKGRTMKDIIHEMHQKKKLDIILIVLPRNVNALYNGIKNFCDRTEGVHTVCVLERKFMNHDATYFANVALIFNLKLGGTNHILKEVDMVIISKGHTMVVRIDVIQPSPGSGKASIASMVASIDKDLVKLPVDLRVQVREGQEMLE